LKVIEIIVILFLHLKVQMKLTGVTTHTCKGKGKGRFLYSATYMVDQEQRALQSRKWQLTGNSQ